ncbi:hypothetical protein MHZ92_04315 [Sporosarcina sp. ACRSL]|uniref:hypothetical protein n=1 Tax=Sporosarcina sp. ACRSL TaxID=2918215 RepID=UPI001EF73FF0|nr:hypothetical protein [Sporosarcina sp. ACRSL]MCG7343342.1 hypothetical protein [Sporosarcina sp. ACRSL]
MERAFIDPNEMELRQDPDYMASLEMIGEGSPVHYPEYTKKLKEATGFDPKELPQTYQ